MSDLRTSIILDLAGNLQQRAQKYTGALLKLGRSGSRSMNMLHRSTALAGKGLDRLGNRYTALLTGAAGIGTAKMVGDLSERMTRLGIQANQGADGVDKLKQQIYEVAKAPEIRVDPTQILGAVEQIVEKTGDLKFAEANLANIGKAIQATGADGQAIGGIMAEFQKMGIIDPSQVLEALDILTVQGKEGAFTLENLASLGPRVVTAYTSMGRGGVGAIREMGAALQLIRQGTGSSEMAATAFEAMLRTLSDPAKLKILRAGGLKLYDPEAAKNGEKVLRPINELMGEIIAKANGDKEILGKVFDAEAVRAFNAAVSEFQRTGGVGSLDKFMQVQADGTVITKDSARAAKEFNSALSYLLTTWRQFADKELTGPISALADTINGLEPGAVDRWLNVGKYIGIAGGAAILAKKTGLFSLGSRLLFGKKGGTGGLGGLASAGGPTPVYVVNKHLSMLPGKDGFGLGGGKSPGSIAKRGKGLLARMLGLGKGALGAGSLAQLGGMGAGTLATSGALAVGAGAGGYGIGTALNEFMGFVSGKLTDGEHGGSGWLGSMIYDALHGEEQQVGGTLKIEIDQDGQARVKEVTSVNPKVPIDVDTGPLVVGG